MCFAQWIDRLVWQALTVQIDRSEVVEVRSFCTVAPHRARTLVGVTTVLRAAASGARWRG